MDILKIFFIECYKDLVEIIKSDIEYYTVGFIRLFIGVIIFILILRELEEK